MTDAIALNFLPLETHEFSFSLFRSPYNDEEKPATSSGELAVMRKLPDEHDQYKKYWTTFGERPNAEKVDLNPEDNNYATVDVLRKSLVTRCEEVLDPAKIRQVHGIRPHVEIIMHTHVEGDQVVSVEPYYLRSKRTFGFLLDFRFHPKLEYRHTPRALQLSLALDRDRRVNLNHYSDRYDHLSAFVRAFKRSLFVLELPGGQHVSVRSSFLDLGVERLDVKRYIVGNHAESASQFMGVKKNGPLEPAPSDVRFYFVYPRKYVSLSRDIYRALSGRTYRTFSGMEEMFGTTISTANVKGIELDSFDIRSIREVQEKVSKDQEEHPAVVVVLTPFSRHDHQDNDAYWTLKHAFLSAGLPIQVVSTTTANDRNLLKWSVGSIGLQIFAKLGGKPWKVRPANSKCLIVGVGQAHSIREDGTISRYFAYSVLTDSSGVFKEIRVLGHSGEHDSYLDEFSTRLEELLRDYAGEFSTFAVHATFSIRQDELKRVSEVLGRLRDEDGEGRAFVALKFNDHNRFFGFATSQNSLVPYESSLVQLAHNEYLVWFEGLQYGQPNVKKMVGGPMHVKFVYPERIGFESKMAYLQDAINLSGANWRGFNAKSLPVSVYYAQIIARYLREFERQNLPEVGVDILPPWFL